MRDPHVAELVYTLAVREGVNYQDPPPVSFGTPVATLQLKAGVLTCEMRGHYSTAQEARNAVQPYLDAWSIHSRLLGHYGFGFRFSHANVIDRNPPEGQAGGSLRALSGSDVPFAQGSVQPRSDFDHYPSPLPLKDFEWNPDVQTLWDRFDSMFKRHEPLQGAAYFCLTLLEARAAPKQAHSTRPPSSKRRAAAKLYNVDVDVLSKLGELSSARGGLLDSRKADATPLTPEEGEWLHQVMREIILRAGLPKGSMSRKLTMADLRTLP